MTARPSLSGQGGRDENRELPARRGGDLSSPDPATLGGIRGATGGASAIEASEGKGVARAQEGVNEGGRGDV